MDFHVMTLSSTTHFPCSSTLISTTTTKRHSSSATSISFSLKPPPHPPPPEPTNPFNSHPLRRPKSLKPTPAPPPPPPPVPQPVPKISKNPLKTLLNPSTVPTPIVTNPHSLSSKLWLSSKLSPPPRPPPPPPPPPAKTQKLRTKKTQENQENAIQENQEPECRQVGKIFVGNLPNWIKKRQLSEFFRQFGPIKNVILIKGHNATERNAGFCFIIYDGATAEKSAMKAVEFDGMEFHGRILTVKLDDGKRLKAKAEERKRWVEGEDVQDYHRSKWHEEREGSRKAFRNVLETRPEDWQAVVTAFERIKKVLFFLTFS